MKKFFLEVLKKLLVGFLLSIILLILSYSFFAGEFPPNFSNMKNGIFGLKSQFQALRKYQELKLTRTLEQDSDHPETEKKQRKRDQELSKLMEELGLNEESQNRNDKQSKQPLTLETLEKQNIILIRKINELDYRLYLLEKKKNSAKNTSRD